MKVSINITDAQIKSGNPVNIELLPSLPANQYYRPYFATLTLKNWVANYTNINAAATLAIVSGTSLSNILTNLVNSLHSAVAGLLGNDGSSIAVLPAVADTSGTVIRGQSALILSEHLGESLVLYINNNASGSLTGGNPAQSLQIDLLYDIVTIT